MDIVIRDTIPISNNGSDKKPPFRQGKQVLRKNRRKNKKDRRKSVRDGVFVSLSHRKERRSGKDRRHTKCY